ncbi:hypothetical protein G9A89_003933 [Geosiphon pyriformis]|nr:hypothetical protein G9A89_003933 [Geosiphon pyriformis]
MSRLQLTWKFGKLEFCVGNYLNQNWEHLVTQVLLRGIVEPGVHHKVFSEGTVLTFGFQEIVKLIQADYVGRTATFQNIILGIFDY